MTIRDNKHYNIRLIRWIQSMSISIFTSMYITLIGVPVLAQSSKTKEIHGIAINHYETGKLNGGILVAEGKKIIYNEAFGMADTEAGIPNTPNTRFPINSITKCFTAILILQLMEEGLINPEDPVSTHLPGFKHPKAGEITIHHLLSHRSGLQDYFLIQLKGEMKFDLTREEMLNKISQMDLEFEPGKGFSYNNTGYVLLGKIIEKYRNKPYKEVLEEYIFNPLNMKESTFSNTDRGPGVAKLYESNGNPAQENLYYIGDGGIISTVGDLHKFAMALNTEALLSEESWKLAFTPHSLPEEANRDFPPHYNPYGYGFSLAKLPFKGSENAFTVAHGGLGFGSSSYMVRFIKEGRIIIIWNNKYLPPDPQTIFEIMAE